MQFLKGRFATDANVIADYLKSPFYAAVAPVVVVVADAAAGTCQSDAGLDDEKT